eukprot:jgi/Mesvir1/28445/Mv15869-RA.1
MSVLALSSRYHAGRVFVHVSQPARRRVGECLHQVLHSSIGMAVPLQLFPEETVVAADGMTLAHTALRNDCAALMLALSRIDLEKGGRYANILMTFFEQFFSFIQMHHDVEDNVLFPALMQVPMPIPGVAGPRLGSLKPGPEAAALASSSPLWHDLEAEHDELIGRIADVRRAMRAFSAAEATLWGDMGARQVALDELRERVRVLVYECLLPHLLKEELTIPQMFRLTLDAQEFVELEVACGAEASRLAGPLGMAWVVHSMSDEQRGAFLEHVPVALRETILAEFEPELMDKYYEPLRKVACGDV